MHAPTAQSTACLTCPGAKRANFRIADQPLAIVSQCCRTADVAISTGREEGGFCLRQ